MNEANFRGDLTQRIVRFLNSIGIETIPTTVQAATFLPGISVVDGRIIVEEDRLAFPGDLLHEAGHLAVAPAHLRAGLNGEVVLPDMRPDVIEAAAIAWSYAACIYLGIDPKAVFHDGGYAGRSESLLFGFELGVFSGLNELESAGLAFSPLTAAERNVAPFPEMQKWLRN